MSQIANKMPQEPIVLADRWQLVRLLGEGSMGEVWHAKHAVLGHDVAVKIMKRDAQIDKEGAARFRREARIAAQIRHRNLVRVEDFGTTSDGKPFLVMEFLRGKSLQETLDISQRVTREFAVLVALHVGAACDVAHAAGIVHRDLKPANCFVVTDDDGSQLVKVLDFGVAKVSDGMFATSNGGNNPLTSAHALLGTPVYMSPEQARGDADIDGRTDLWSLAVMLFELLTGQLPFERDSVSQLLLAIISDSPEIPSRFDRTLPKSVDQWFARALARDRAHRFSSGKDLAQTFASALGLSHLVQVVRTSIPSIPPVANMTQPDVHSPLFPGHSSVSGMVQTVNQVSYDSVRMPTAAIDTVDHPVAVAATLSTPAPVSGAFSIDVARAYAPTQAIPQSLPPPPMGPSPSIPPRPSGYPAPYNGSMMQSMHHVQSMASVPLPQPSHQPQKATHSRALPWIIVGASVFAVITLAVALKAAQYTRDARARARAEEIRQQHLAIEELRRGIQFNNQTSQTPQQATVETHTHVSSTVPAVGPVPSVVVPAAPTVAIPQQNHLPLVSAVRVAAAVNAPVLSPTRIPVQPVRTATAPPAPAPRTVTTEQNTNAVRPVVPVQNTVQTPVVPTRTSPQQHHGDYNPDQP